MAERTPVGEPLVAADAAAVTPWAEARERIEMPERDKNYWLATVRPDGRPHVRPILCSSAAFREGGSRSSQADHTDCRRCGLPVARVDGRWMQVRIPPSSGESRPDRTGCRSRDVGCAWIQRGRQLQ